MKFKLIDEEQEPTIWTAISYLAALIFMGAMFYLFILGMAGAFGERERGAWTREPDSVVRKSWETSTAQGRDTTSGFGYYDRKRERGR